MTIMTINAHNNVFKTEQAVRTAWKLYLKAAGDFGDGHPVADSFYRAACTAQKRWAQAKKTLRRAESEREEQLSEMAALQRRQGWLRKALAAKAS